MKKLIGLFIVAALACALPLVADSIKLDAVSDNSQGGVFTAPYFLSIGGGADISAMCIDFTHHSTVGETWDGNISALIDGDLDGTRLGDSGYVSYREQAWLYSQFMAGAGPSGDINYAVWAITSADAKTSAGWTDGAQHWYELATMTDLTGFSTVSFNIITPKDLTGTGSQEFITTSTAPEPAGLVLVGSGLLGLAGFGRRKLRKTF
jgi:hypothetical protein